MKSGWEGAESQKDPGKTPQCEYLAPLLPSEQMGTAQLEAFPHLYPPKPSLGTPESTLVPGHAGEGVAVDGIEVIMVWHVMGKDFSVYHVAFTLLTRFVHGLWGRKHH